MFAHKSVPHLLSQHALACMAKALSFHNTNISFYLETSGGQNSKLFFQHQC
jgi:hypothetical protein